MLVPHKIYLQKISILTDYKHHCTLCFYDTYRVLRQEKAYKQLWQSAEYKKIYNLNARLVIVYGGWETIIHYCVYLGLLYLHIGMYVGEFNCEVVKSTFRKPSHPIWQEKKKDQVVFCSNGNTENNVLFNQDFIFFYSSDEEAFVKKGFHLIHAVLHHNIITLICVPL